MENSENQINDENEQKSAEDIKQNVELKKNRQKVDIAIVVSILALLISVIHLIITSPFFIDAYNKPKIVVNELENMITEPTTVQSAYEIINESNKTANNLILGVDLYDIESIGFYPENAFKLSDSIPGWYFFKNRYFFTKNNLIPDEMVTVFLSNRIDTIAKKVGVDSLKPYWEYKCQELVPHIEELKSDLGYAKINRPDKYIINAYKLEFEAPQKLEGKPIDK